MSDIERITELEIQLAHATRLAEELSDIVAEQTKRLELVERRIQMLMERAAEQEAQSLSGEVVGNQPPPHW
ncbi:SlyX family protein [Amylibacter sp. SFDW26]|uniref:SlyX family protein n=1 Tax=Amylibacter sp. SFDW26 TaxID=2652722 RepID=UPI0012615E69|nr:SlyX family protein [Amylibacter sp. SFDW26]KAB7613736.1 SlyX family protein [Amylibacter sp. SFDW26]